MIGTRTWWLKQGSLILTTLGAFLTLAGLYGFWARPGLRAAGVLVVGIAVTVVGGVTWRRLANQDSVEKLEEAIYGSEY